RTSVHLDFARAARDFEDRVRQRFISPTRYQWKLKSAHAPFAAGEVVRETFSEPGWTRWFDSFDASKGEGEQAQTVRISGREVEIAALPNPQYNPEVDIHIVGFAKVVGDVTDATLKVCGFFGIAVVGTMLALWWYLGSFRLALLPLCCSLVAVVWEFGLLKTFGYGVDPFAILVPFLVLAVSTSHGVQYVNTWADEVVAGSNSFDASRNTFRRLFIPGSIALATNVAGFATIYQVPIGIIREMSVNACLGMLAVIVTNKLMMPVWLSYLRLPHAAQFRTRRAARLGAADPLWRMLAHVTARPLALAMIAGSLIVLALSWWKQSDRIVGDTTTGVPELTADSQYNRDSRAIAGNFAIGIDVLTVVAEADPNSCIHYDVLDQIDRFDWTLRNVEGVQATASVAQLVKTVNQAFSDMSVKFHSLPRNENVMVLLNSKLTTGTGLLNWDCTAMPVYLYTADHRAETLRRIVAAVDAFNTRNAAEFFETHYDVDAAYCAAKTAARRATPMHGQSADEHAATGYDKTCPVNFALALGNAGVAAATNDVVEQKELATVLWVYVAIVLFLLLAYRSFGAVLAICIPLFMVSIFANCLMALFGIGLKVATLPVVSLAVGIGVDYGIYFYDVMRHEMRENHRALADAYYETLRQTGKAVIFTGLCLAGGVATWLWSDLQFQRDMGLLLMCMFIANMLGAILLIPAYCRFLMRETGSPHRYS
ncbi:MAG TPA: efflux RND transporter permease subunit, partial [Rhodanobacteraceae bacterium]|nr:efflux RND transporter permease subunit [Rhodanobacteraceae bacterium]